MKKEKLIQDKFCRDCSNHYNEKNEGKNGFILCECRLDSTIKLDRLMNYDYCKNIKINVNERN